MIKVYYSRLITNMFFVALAAIVSSCSARSAAINSGLQSAVCKNGEKVMPVVSIIGGVNQNQTSMGMPVQFSISATGCGGNYLVSRVSAASSPQSFTSTMPASISVTYTSMTPSVTEVFQVQAIDAATKGVIATVQANSPTFSVGAALTCSALASNASMTIPVDINNQPTGSASFSFQVTSSVPTLLFEVSKNGSVIAATGVPGMSASTSVNTQVAINTLGISTLLFRIKDPVTNSQSSCGASVTTTAAPIGAPVITGFGSDPQSIAPGASSTLTLSVSGAVTSASINGNDVSISGGKGTLSVSPTDYGPNTFTASVTGPGGTVTKPVTVMVAPTCAMTAPAQKSVTENYPFTITINGQFLSASLTGNGLTQVGIPAGTGLVNHVENSKVLGAYGPSKAYLTVNGPNSSSSTCQVDINTAIVQISSSSQIYNVVDLVSGTTLGVNAGLTGYIAGWFFGVFIDKLQGAKANVPIIASINQYNPRVQCKDNEVGGGIFGSQLSCYPMVAGLKLKNRINVSGDWVGGSGGSCPDSNQVITALFGQNGATSSSGFGFECSQIGGNEP